MELPRISLDDVKSKFGFSGPQDAGRSRRSYQDDYDDGYDDGYADEPVDDYGSGYGDDYTVAYDDGLGDGYEDPGSLYEPYNQVTTRSAGRRHSTVSSPRLVNATDVRASTHYTPSESVSAPTSSSSSYRRSRGSSSFRTLIDDTTPAPSSPADMSGRKERSESLDGLFGGQTAPSETSTAGAAPASKVGVSSRTLVTDSYDPYDSYKNSSTTIHTPSRGLEIIKPQAYNDVERVAKILRAGDVAILALNGTPGDLSKRVLDFSFGVASALDASVDLAAPKVFVITTGAPLSDAERMKLRSQGLM